MHRAQHLFEALLVGSVPAWASPCEAIQSGRLSINKARQLVSHRASSPALRIQRRHHAAFGISLPPPPRTAARSWSGTTQPHCGHSPTLPSARHYRRTDSGPPCPAGGLSPPRPPPPPRPRGVVVEFFFPAPRRLRLSARSLRWLPPAVMMASLP